MTKKILMAVDGSNGSKRAMMRTIDWFPVDTEYHAVFVHAPDETIRIPDAIPPHAATGGLDPEPGLGRIIDEREKEFIEKLLRDVMDSRGVEIRLHIRRGDPRHEIVGIAEEMGVDLIVIGSRGHGSISRLLLGSVSSFVLEHAPVSALVVR